MIVNDATYSVNNPNIGCDRNDEKFLVSFDVDIGFDDIYTVVENVNRFYTEYAKSLKDEIVINEIRPIPSMMYGESFELVLPVGAARIDQNTQPKLRFSKTLNAMTISFNTLEVLRLMTSSLVSKSISNTTPEIFYIKNSSVSDFTSKKYNPLIENSVFQLESDMEYSSPVQTAEHVIELDIIRSLITKRSTNFLKTVFDKAFNKESLETTVEDHYKHMINLTSFIQFTEVIAFASDVHKMTQVYLPVQTIVHDVKLNSLLLSAYYEAFARIALINNKNTSKSTNLIIRYPAHSPKSEFVNIMLPMLAVLKNRAVRIIFYGTSEDILKDSPFDCKELTE